MIDFFYILNVGRPRCSGHVAFHQYDGRRFANTERGRVNDSYDGVL